MVEQVHQQYYEQMPQQQQGSLMQGLIGALTQHGYDPQQAGIQNTNPSTMSPGEAARMIGYAQQQNPGLLQQIMGPGGQLGSTGAKMTVKGIAALAAKQMFGGSSGGMNLEAAQKARIERRRDVTIQGDDTGVQGQ